MPRVVKKKTVLSIPIDPAKPLDVEMLEDLELIMRYRGYRTKTAAIRQLIMAAAEIIKLDDD